MPQLEPIEPETATEMYLAERRDELADATVKTHCYHLQYFCEWCEVEEITNLNDLTGRDLFEYRTWRKERGKGINRVTLQTQLSTLRVFLRWCEGVEAVSQGLADKIILPSRNGEDRRSTMLEADRADQILDYLRKFHYASRDHALFTVLWHTGMRTGAVQSLDVEDYYPRKQCLELCHRPEKGTTLKNGQHGGRFVALNSDVCTVLDDYIEMRRIDAPDDYGREPLFTTDHGRMGKVTIRRTAYRLTRPCEYAGKCPHDRDPEDCEAAQSYDGGSKCPSTVSAHPIRRGSITHHLLQDVPEPAVSDRCDVSADILDAHYDERTSKEKMEQRRGYLNNL